jgi:hypothetical protein
MNLVTAVRRGLAPRTQAGIDAIEHLTNDGAWHTYNELLHAITAAGLAQRTAQNLIAASTRCQPPLLERKGRQYRTPTRSPR